MNLMKTLSLCCAGTALFSAGCTSPSSPDRLLPAKSDVAPQATLTIGIENPSSNPITLSAAEAVALRRIFAQATPLPVVPGTGFICRLPASDVCRIDLDEDCWFFFTPPGKLTDYRLAPGLQREFRKLIARQLPPHGAKRS